MTERGLKVKESFGTDEYAHYLDYDDDSTAMYICQDLSDSTLQIHVLYDYSSIKLFFFLIPPSLAKIEIFLNEFC